MTAAVSVAAIRYWRGLAGFGSHDMDEADPWAMPLIVRVERTASPPKSESGSDRGNASDSGAAEPAGPDHLSAVGAAAQATVLLLADPRSAPDAEWHPALDRWRAGRIRKVARRGRGIRWTEAVEQPGITATVGESEVRALLPHPVADPPPSVKKMQVSGLNLPTRPAVEGATRTSASLKVVGAPGLALSTGKACAQAAHAAQLALEQLDEAAVLSWADAGFAVTVFGFGDPQALDRDGRPSWDDLRFGRIPAAIVQDGGFTEVAPGTTTCAAYF